MSAGALIAPRYIGPVGNSTTVTIGTPYEATDLGVAIPGPGVLNSIQLIINPTGEGGPGLSNWYTVGWVGFEIADIGSPSSGMWPSNFPRYTTVPVSTPPTALPPSYVSPFFEIMGNADPAAALYVASGGTQGAAPVNQTYSYFNGQSAGSLTVGNASLMELQGAVTYTITTPLGWNGMLRVHAINASAEIPPPAVTVTVRYSVSIG
ncbi:MAG: hypothetical protein ACREB9_00700 [Thermoplasmata archaeon]